MRDRFQAGQVFAYLSGFPASRAWRPVSDITEAKDVIRSATPYPFDIIDSVYVCTRVFNEARRCFVPLDIQDTFTKDSWEGGEYTTSELAMYLIAGPGDNQRSGIMPDDWYYVLSLTRGEGTYIITVRRYSVTGATTTAQNVPEFNVPTEEQAFQEANDPPLIENRRNTWRFRYAVLPYGVVPDGNTVYTEWVEESPPQWRIPPIPLPYNPGDQPPSVQVYAEEASQDSERLGLLFQWDNCALVKAAAADIHDPTYNIPGVDPIGLHKGTAVLTPVMAVGGNLYTLNDHPDTEEDYETLRGFGFPEGQALQDHMLYGRRPTTDELFRIAQRYTQPDYNPGNDPLVDYRAFGDTAFYNIVDPQLTDTYLFSGDVGLFLASGGRVTLAITAPNGVANGSMPRWNELRPRYDQWCFDGYCIRAEAIVTLGNGFVQYNARSRWPASLGPTDFRNISARERPEYKGPLGNPNDLRDGDPEAERWYYIVPGVTNMGDANHGFFPSDSQYAPGSNDQITFDWLRYMSAYVPYGPGSVWWSVTLVISISARYRMGNDHPNCDQIKFSAERAVKLHFRAETGADNTTEGLGHAVYHQIGGLDGDNPPDYGQFLPELFYNNEKGSAGWSTHPWDEGLLIYEPGPHRKYPPSSAPPKLAEHSPLAPIVGWLDESNRTHEELRRLNPTIAYLLDNKVGIFARIARLFFASENDAKPSSDEAKDFAMMLNRKLVLAMNYFIKTIDEGLLTGDGPNLQAFALYFSDDVFVPVPITTLTGPNGEGPLYGWPLLNGWAEDDGTIGTGESDEAKEQIELFNVALLDVCFKLSEAVDAAMEAAADRIHDWWNNPILDAILDDLVKDNSFVTAREKYYQRARFMTPIRGSGIVLGYWRS